MLHPSYTDLIQIVNSEVEPGEQPVIKSRYSIVLASAKRARQIIDGAKPLVSYSCTKPLSIAVDELYQGKIKIVSSDEEEAQPEAAVKNVADIGELDEKISDILNEEIPDVLNDGNTDALSEENTDAEVQEYLEEDNEIQLD